MRCAAEVRSGYRAWQPASVRPVGVTIEIGGESVRSTIQRARTPSCLTAASHLLRTLAVLNRTRENVEVRTGLKPQNRRIGWVMVRLLLAQ